jgi:hypothetical protein
MVKFIQRLLRLRREGRLKAAIMNRVGSRLAYHCMRWGLNSTSCWLARFVYAYQSREVGFFRYQSVSSWSNERDSRQGIYPARSLTLNPVHHIGYQCVRSDIFCNTHTVSLPSVTLELLHQVDVIGGSEMVFTSDGTVLYDEMALGNVYRYGTKIFGISLHGTTLLFPAANRKFLQCFYHRTAQPILIPRAISLLKDHSGNYYHWLLECLPRAILALRQTDFAEDPWLIDSELPDQFIETLRLLSPARQFITIPKGLRISVEKLCFPSVLSSTHDYYGASLRPDDFLIAPEAAALLRDAFRAQLFPSKSEVKQHFIYVARSGGAHRTITNELEIMSILVEMGFTIVYPGKLKFVEQITLFTNAKIIVGPTGAGMANIVFAKPECKIVILAAATCNANYYVFAQLAQHFGQIVYVGGRPNSPSSVHSEYQIDGPDLRNLVAEYMG